MFHKLKPKSEFSRNVLTLMTGTTIAQACPVNPYINDDKINYISEKLK